MNLQSFFPLLEHKKSLIKESINKSSLITIKGKVLESTSLIIRASAPRVSVGDICLISKEGDSEKHIKAQAVGFKQGDVFLMPLGEVSGLSPRSEVIPTNKPFMLKAGYGLLGRVLNGLGEPMDDLGPLEDVLGLVDWPLHRPAPDPYRRKLIYEPMAMGIRAIDSLLTIGKGQRIGLFAGSGVGKSSLMGQMVRNCESKIVVVCLVGERGREVREFVEQSLGEEGKKKCVMVVATSDTPSLVRQLSAFVATAIAEWFRDQGEDVLFLMDSVTRFARAQREIGLALGEPPARQGYPPSVFAELPKLMERTGTSNKGSITAIYTVLVQGSDFDEPISDEVRGILDGHIVLSRDLADQGHWPAIDALRSLSRIMHNIVDEEQRKGASALRRVLSCYYENKDLITLGAYKKGSITDVDLALEKWSKIENFLCQPIKEKSSYNQTRSELIGLLK